MQISQCLEQAAATLAAAGLENPRLEARVLLCYVLERESAYLFAHGDEELPAEQCVRFLTCIAQRAGGKPLAYITGSREFYALQLQVSPQTMIPRPDTETLVDLALELDKSHHFMNILDLGTGSGAIIIALARHLPGAQCTGIDISAAALDIARLNARLHQVEVEFLESDWFAVLRGRFDLIVTNPPYIREGDGHLDALGFEPRQALIAGSDGLRDIAAIVRQAPRHLLEGGVLLTEHGWDQARAVREIFTYCGYADIRTVKDLQGHERVTMGRRL